MQFSGRTYCVLTPASSSVIGLVRSLTNSEVAEEALRDKERDRERGKYAVRSRNYCFFKLFFRNYSYSYFFLKFLR